MDNLLVLKDECPKIDPLLREISDTQNVGYELRKMFQKFGELEGKILITNGADTKKVSCIKIPRAGVPLGDGFVDAFRCDLTGYISAIRDEKNLIPKLEYIRPPPFGGTDLYVVDSIIATGGSICAPLEVIKNMEPTYGSPRKITVVSTIAAEHGLMQIIENYDVDIVAGMVVNDMVPGGLGSGLDENGFVLNPYGISDWGDRMYEMSKK